MTARLLLLGYPKAGKTGAIAALANAGRKVRYLDFDNNIDSLRQYTNKDSRKNIDRVPCLDRLDFKKFGTGDIGIDLTSFVSWPTMVAALEKWPSDGSNPSEWDNNNVLVFDSLTAMAQARWRATLKLNARRDARMNYKLVQDQIADLLTLIRDNIRCPVVVLAHIQIVGPDFHVDEDIEDINLKEKILYKKLQGAQIIDPYFGPVSVGQKGAQVLPSLFSGVALLHASDMGRFIYTTPRNGFHLAVPVPGLDKELPISTGLATLINAWAPIPKSKAASPPQAESLETTE